jgi:hypothetical protein
VKADDMNKQEILNQIAELIELQERAIQHHPPETSSVYRKYRDAFIEGQRTAEETEWSRAMSLSLEELSLMHRYMLCSSFISAWYHLSGDRARRDKAAHSCSIVVAGLGPDSNQAFLKHLKYEQMWREAMKSEGIAPPPLRAIGIAIVVLIVLAVIIAFVILRLAP